MAMTMTGETIPPADRPRVWELLDDPETLKACIPGCESLERVGDNGFAAVVKTKIGPVSATFRGKVELSDLIPLVGYAITGEGEGGIAGFAKGQAKVALADAPGGTLLHYDVEAHVGGKIAQLGASDRRRRQEHGRQIFRQFRRHRRRRRSGARTSRPNRRLHPPPRARRRSHPWRRRALRRPSPRRRGKPNRRGAPSQRLPRRRRAMRRRKRSQRKSLGSEGFGNGSCLDDGKRPASLD
jgi:uncharacterized protein